MLPDIKVEGSNKPYVCFPTVCVGKCKFPVMPLQPKIELGSIDGGKTMTKAIAFISYAHEDFEAARRLYRDLKQAGLDVWFDKESLLPGQRWKVAIKQAIKNSRYFLALLSSHSVTRAGFVHSELAEAMEVLDDFPESDIFIILVRLDDCKPSHEKLRDLHWADMFPKWEDGLARILRSMGVESPPPLPPIGEVDPEFGEPKPSDLILIITNPKGFNALFGSNSFLQFSEWLSNPLRPGSNPASFEYPIEGKVLPSIQGLVVEIAIYTNQWWAQGKYPVLADGTFSGTVFLDRRLPSAIFRFDIMNSKGDILKRFDVNVS